MTFRFITIPMKRPLPLRENSDVDLTSISLDVKKDIQTKRSACISKLETLRNGFEKGEKYRDSFWQTADGRENLINSAIEGVNIYSTEIANILYKFPVFAYGFYYHWSSSLTEKQSLAFDDFRYDLQCMYFNIAAALMNFTEDLLCWKMSISNASALEKECYHYLLQAAGYFSLVKNISDDVKSFIVGKTRLAPPEDITKPFLEFCETIALAQAQEIGTTKAVEKEIKGGKSLVARLSHQLLKLYQEASKIAEKSIASTSNEYMDIKMLVMLKVDIFHALTFSHTASDVFDKSPSEGLWFALRSDVLVKEVIIHRDQAKKKKKKIPFRGDDLIQGCCDIVKRNYERCTRINALSHRVKPVEGPLKLPPPTILAQKKEIKLPVPFPHQVVPPKPPVTEDDNKSAD